MNWPSSPLMALALLCPFFSQMQAQEFTFSFAEFVQMASLKSPDSIQAFVEANGYTFLRKEGDSALSIYRAEKAVDQDEKEPSICSFKVTNKSTSLSLKVFLLHEYEDLIEQIQNHPLRFQEVHRMPHSFMDGTVTRYRSEGNSLLELVVTEVINNQNDGPKIIRSWPSYTITINNRHPRG